MTHHELCERGYRWLKNHVHCNLALLEFRHAYGVEHPDVIGWKTGISYLIECKISLADYKCDTAKRVRKNFPELAMGNFRYYLVPAGLIKEAITGWGLLYAHPNNHIEVIEKAPWIDINLAMEREILCAALRRLCERVSRQR